VKFYAWVASVGESGEKNKKERPYFTYFARRSLTADWHKFWVTFRLVDVINCAKFYRNQLRGSDSMSGQNLSIPIGLRYHC